MSSPTPLNVLIVEDRPEDAELMVLELKRSGFSVTSRRAQTADEFMAGLREGADLILSDYNMPQFSGADALRMLKASCKDIPLIIVTGSISEEVAVECMKQGAADYLLKDRLARLGSAARAAIQQKRMRDGELAANRSLEEFAETQRILLRELDHRVRNNLASLLALIDLSRRSVSDVEAFAGSIGGRVRAMAGVHNLLSQSHFQPLRLSELIRLLSPQYGPGRIQSSGPEVAIPARQVSALGVLMHELFTNSRKHGAVGSTKGVCQLTWTLAQGENDISTLRMTMEDRGGPPILTQPYAKSGLHLIEGLAKSELGGTCQINFPREGARIEMTISLDPSDSGFETAGALGTQGGVGT